MVLQSKGHFHDMTTLSSMHPPPVQEERPSPWTRSWCPLRYSSVAQLLWDKLEEKRSLVGLIRQRAGLRDDEVFIVKQCEEKLEKARQCLTRWPRRSFLFWGLIHDFDEMMLLVMPEEMLSARALDIQGEFEKNIPKDDILYKIWMGIEVRGPLATTVHRLSGRERKEGESWARWPESQLREDRNILQGALHTINQQVDKWFWHLSMNVFIQVFSGLLLVLLFVLALLFDPYSPIGSMFHWNERLGGMRFALAVGDSYIISLILLGAGGAIVANMLRKESFVLSTGASSRYVIYYVLFKPVIGAFAGLFLFLLERSQLLFEVSVRPPGASTQIPPTGNSIIQIVVGSQSAELFVLAVLAVAFGFSAEKWLASTMDEVLGRILNKSDKMQSTRSGSGAKST